MKSAPLAPLALAYHELRNPLALIVTAARLAAEEAPDAATRARSDVIVRAAEGLLRRASAVLALGHEPQAPGLFTPARVLERLAGLPLGAAAPVRLTIDARAHAVASYGDRDAFEALLSSLIANARDHGDAAHAVRLSLRLRPGCVETLLTNRLRVHDTHQGFGLGAGIVRALALHAGASLEVRSGRRYYSARLRLPLAAASAFVAPARE